MPQNKSTTRMPLSDDGTFLRDDHQHATQSCFFCARKPKTMPETLKACGISSHTWYLMLLLGNLYRGFIVVLSETGLRIPNIWSTDENNQMYNERVDRFRLEYDFTWLGLVPAYIGCFYKDEDELGSLNGNITESLSNIEFSDWGVRYKRCAFTHTTLPSLESNGLWVQTPIVVAYVAVWSSLLLLNEARRGMWPTKGRGRSGDVWVNRAYYVALSLGMTSVAHLFFPAYRVLSSTFTIGDESPGSAEAYDLLWFGVLGQGIDGVGWRLGQYWVLSAKVFFTPLVAASAIGGVVLMRAAGGFRNKRGCCGVGCCTCKWCDDCAAPCCDVRKPEGEVLWLRENTPSITLSVA